MVPARLTVLTIGARDLPSLRDFYKALGWPLVVDLDDFAAFGTSGAVFTLYALDNLVADTNAGTAASGSGFNGVTPAVNVDSREEVDEAIETARRAGAEIVKPPVDMEWGGRSGYFKDPEGNYWEIAWVPADTKVAQAVRHAMNLE
jgi:catechol 2,3-dioxygenase-like lactoylglutathione lyase family enzyme